MDIRVNVSKVTIWHRLDENENWQFNHIEDDWVDDHRPRGIGKEQIKNWSNGTWFKHYGLKDKDGRVYEYRVGV